MHRRSRGLRFARSISYRYFGRHERRTRYRCGLLLITAVFESLSVDCEQDTTLTFEWT
jgi:hypothetical protein